MTSNNPSGQIPDFTDSATSAGNLARLADEFFKGRVQLPERKPSIELQAVLFLESIVLEAEICGELDEDDEPTE